MIDAATRRVVYRNEESRRIVASTGKSPESVDDYDQLEVQRLDGTPMPLHELPSHHTLATGESVHGVAFVLLSPHGASIYITADATPVHDSQKKLVGAVVTWRDISAERVVAVELAQKERNEEFLLLVSDAVRDLTDPEEIIATKVRLVGSYLRVNRCSYGQIDVEHDRVRVFPEYVNGVQDHAGEYELSRFGSYFASLHRTGAIVTVADSATDPQTRDFYDQTYGPFGLRAFIVVPLIKEGRFVAFFGVYQASPRSWKPSEVALVRKMADRLWANIERANSERALRDSEARYRALLEGLPQLVWSTDAQGVGDYLGPQWATYTGLPIEGPLNDLFRSAIHPEDRDRVRSEWRKAVAGEQEHQIEFRIRSAEGEYRWFRTRAIALKDAEGRTVKWLGTSTDIQDQRLAVDIQERRARQQHAIALAAIRIHRARTAEEALQIAAEEARQAIDADLATYHLFPSDVSENIDPGLIEFCALVGQEQALRISREDWDHRAEWTGLPLGVAHSFERTLLAAMLFSSSGDCLGFVLLADRREGDFTSEDEDLLTQFSQMASAAIENARLTNELETRVAERTGLLMQKVEELEGFTYTVSHDMRAPLRSIVGNARLVLMDEGDSVSSEGKVMLRRLADAALRMSTLVDDLLEYARSGSKTLVREPISFAKLAEEIAVEVRKEHPSATIQVTISPDTIVSGDARLLGLVLRNLLENACKYTLPDVPAQVQVGEEPGSEAVFFVRDQGVGFDMAHLGKLFQPFSRLHPEKEYAGTGIGLANVRRIVERHGGRVWAEGALGMGTTFWFALSPASGERNFLA